MSREIKDPCADTKPFGEVFGCCMLFVFARQRKNNNNNNTNINNNKITNLYGAMCIAGVREGSANERCEPVFESNLRSYYF